MVDRSVDRHTFPVVKTLKFDEQEDKQSYQ